MKYLVKNRKTGEETICEKVVVDGFVYYLNNSAIKLNEWCFEVHNGLTRANLTTPKFTDGVNTWWLRKSNMNTGSNDPECKKVIATNNKSLDLPMVIDEVEVITEQLCIKKGSENNTIDLNAYAGGVINGYNKAKEKYQFTKEDLIDFKQQASKILEQLNGASDKDLFDLWQQQRTIKVEVE